MGNPDHHDLAPPFDSIHQTVIAHAQSEMSGHHPNQRLNPSTQGWERGFLQDRTRSKQIQTDPRIQTF